MDTIGESRQPQEQTPRSDAGATHWLADSWIEPGDLDTAHRQIVEAALRTFGADVCVLFVLNPINGEFESAPLSAGTLSARDSIELPRAQGFAREILKRSSLLVEDLAQQPEWSSSFSKREGIRSFAALALGAHPRPEPFAVLYIDFRQPHPFSAADRKDLEDFSEKASYLLENTWLLSRYRTVIRVGHELNQEVAAEGLFRKLDEHVSRILDTSCLFMLAVYFSQTDTMDLYCKKAGDFTVEEGRAVTAECRKVIDERTSLVIESFSEEKRAGLLSEPGDLDERDPRGPESQIFIPLLLRDVALGVLSVQHLKPRAFDRQDLHLLEVLANHVASALSGMQLLADLEVLNETGQLLAEELDPDQLLPLIVEEIRTATRSDLVILYPYQAETGRLRVPPVTAGDLRRPDFPQPQDYRPGDVPYRTADRENIRFLTDASELYADAAALPTQETFQQREGILSTAEVPLWVSGETVGVLYVNYRRQQRFSPSQKRTIESLALYAAVALKNARRFTRHEQEMGVLRKVDIEISRSSSLEEVLQAILSGANELIRAEHASIILVNPETMQLQVISAIGQQAEEIKRSTPTVDPGRGITRRAFETGEPIRVGDVHAEAEWKDVFIDMIRDIHAELDVPLLDPEGGRIGVINFESPRRNAFTEADQRFAGTLAGQVVLAVKKARVYELAERRYREQAKLIEVSRRMISELDLRELLHVILLSALETAKASAGALLLYDEKRQNLLIRAEVGSDCEHEQRIPLDRGIVGLAARDCTMLNIDPTEPQWSGIHIPFASGSRSELAVPLLSGDRLWGVLNIESQVPLRFREAAVWLLVKAFADLAVVALQNSERYEAAETGRQRLFHLQEVSQEIIGQSTDPDQVMQAIVTRALRLTSSNEADLDLYEAGKPVRTYYFNVAGESPVVDKFDLTAEGAPTLPRGIISHVATTLQPYWTQGDAEQDPYYVAGANEVHSEIAVPLCDQDELIGVLNIDNWEPFAFDEKTAELLTLFAAEAVIAIQNARSHQRAERELARFRSLLETGQRLGELNEPKQRAAACEIVTSEAVKQCDGIAVVRGYDEITQDLVVVGSSGGSGIAPFERMKIAEGINGYVARVRRTVRIDDTRNPPPELPLPQLSNPNTLSLLVTPISFRDVYYGNLGLAHEKADKFSEEDEDLIEGLAGLLAVTFHRLDAIQKEQDLLERGKQNEVMGWIGEAAFGLAHRLGNDMGLIKTYINRVRNGLARHRVQDLVIEENLEDVVRATALVLGLSQKLIQETATFRLEEPGIVEVQEIFDEVQESVRLPESVSLTFEIHEGTSSISVVASQVVDILRNLIKNAFEAMPQGGSVEVSARETGTVVRIDVADNGPGIAEEDHEKIFRFLYSKKKSSGFGLWSARRKAWANGGDLIVESKIGEGARFILTLLRAETRLEVRT